MISKKIEQAINKQINAELWSGYLYLSMSAYFEDWGLGGFAHWMRCQAREETDHAMRLYYHLVERRGRIKLDAITVVPTQCKSPLEVFEETYKHDNHMINTRGGWRRTYVALYPYIMEKTGLSPELVNKALDIEKAMIAVAIPS